MNSDFDFENWLRESTASSAVPLVVIDTQAVQEIAQLLAVA